MGFDRAVREEEGLPVGCAGVQGDGILMVGVDIGACGGTGEEGAKRAGGDGHKVGALVEGVRRDGDGCPDMVGEGGGRLCGIRYCAKASETNHLRGIDGRWGQEAGRGGCGGQRRRRVRERACRLGPPVRWGGGQRARGGMCGGGPDVRLSNHA